MGIFSKLFNRGDSAADIVAANIAKGGSTESNKAESNTSDGSESCSGCDSCYNKKHELCKGKNFTCEAYRPNDKERENS